MMWPCLSRSKFSGFKSLKRGVVAWEQSYFHVLWLTGMQWRASGDIPKQRQSPPSRTRSLKERTWDQNFVDNSAWKFSHILELQIFASTKCQRKKRLKFCKICEVINIPRERLRLKKETNEKELMVDDGICGGWQGGVIETTTVSVVKRGIVFKATSSKTDNRCKKGRSVLTFCVCYKMIFDQKSFLRILKLRVAVRKKWGMRSCRRCGSKAAIGVSLSQSSAVVDLNSYTTSTMPQFEKEIRTFAGQTRRRDRCGILPPGFFLRQLETKPCFG